MDKDSTQHDFISTVSHELRTPLTSIRGFAQTMLSSWDVLDEDSKKQFLKIIEEQSNRLIKLVENILAVSKSQNSSNYVFKNVEPNSAIKNVIPVIQQQYPSKNIVFDYNKNLPEILIDKDSIKISDIGVEIKDEDKERIFEKFSRIDNPLTRSVQGSGLGLYITKNLVENMNGLISVESNSNKTTFEVLMPVCDIENQARAKCKQ